MTPRRFKPSARALALGVVAIAIATTVATTHAIASSSPHSYSNSGTLTYESNGQTVTKTYTNLEDLFDDAEDADTDVTIDMLGDWNTEDLLIEVPDDRNYTLNLHGHVLDRHKAGQKSDSWYGSSSGEVILVNDDATLTVNGGTDNESHTTHVGEYTPKWPFWKFDPDHGTQYANGGLITGGAGEKAGGILVDGDNSKVYLNDVTVLGNVCDTSWFTFAITSTGIGSGAGVSLRGYKSSLELSNSAIAYNHAEDDGGGVAMVGRESNVTLKNYSSIRANEAADDGGGVVIYGNDSKLVIDEGDEYKYGAWGIWGNDAEDNGGGIYVNASGSKIEVKGSQSEISSNDAEDDGGGIYVDSSDTTISMDKGKISSNKAGDNGGGIYHNASGGKVSLTNGASISNNSTGDGNGGGVYDYRNDTTFELDASFISNNEAEGDGGGLYLNDAATVILKNGSGINENKAQILYPSGYTTPSCNGGGIYVDDNDTTISLNNSSINSNTVQYGDGGGIYHNASDGTVILNNNSAISGNTVSGKGGGIYNYYDGTTYTLENNSSISNNTAGSDGGGMFLNDKATVNLTDSYIKENKAINGGGIYLDDKSCAINMTSSIIQKNTASADGGGIYNNHANNTVSMKESSGINENTAGGNGGGVYSCNTLYLGSSSGSINWNKAKNGAGVWFKGIMHLTDLTISQNEASNSGGGVYPENNTNSLAFRLEKTVKITDNTAAGTTDNLHLRGTKTIVGGVGDEEVTAQSRIGITVEGFSSGSHRFNGNGTNLLKQTRDNYAEVFLSDSPAFSVALEEDQLYLVDTPASSTLTCYGASDALVRSESVAYNTKVELSTSDYLDDGLAPDWWTISGLDGTSKLYPDKYGVTSFAMPNNEVTLHAHYPEAKTLTLEWGNNQTTTLKYVAGSEVKLKTHDYEKEADDAPSWWVIEDSDGNTTKVYTSYFTTFTMPMSDATATAYYPVQLKSTSMTLGENSSWETLTNDEAPSDQTNYLSVSPVTKLALEDTNNASCEPSAVWFKNGAGATKREVSNITDPNGTVTQKKVTYTVKVEGYLLDYYGFKLAGDPASVANSIKVASSSLGTFDASDASATFDGSDLVLTFTVTFDNPDANQHTVKVTGQDVNAPKNKIATESQRIKDGQTATIEVPSVSGWTFVGWNELPDDAVLDEATNAVTLSQVADDVELEANYQPIATDLTLSVAAPTIGGAFPFKLNSAEVSVDKKRDITALANDTVSFTWKKADGSDAGDAVEGDTIYEGTISTKLPSDGWQYAWSSQATATVNGVAASSVKIDADAGVVTVTWLATTGPDKRYDSVITKLSDMSLAQASDYKDYLPDTISYKLKNGETRTANANWDTSDVDETITSGSFTVSGTFKDQDKTTHKISRSFKLLPLNAPKSDVSRGSYEETQTVQLSLGSDWDDADDAQIYYAIVDTGASQPAIGEFVKYTAALTIDKSCTVYTYATVGNRETKVSKYVYAIGDEHTVSVTDGDAYGTDGKKDTVATVGEVVTIKADNAEEGMQFDHWEIVEGDVELKDANASETTFTLKSNDVELKATYKETEAKKHTVTFDSKGGSNVEAQTLNDSELAKEPANPTKAGYTFAGWQLDDTPYDFELKVKHDITLTASWNKVTASATSIAKAKVTLSKTSLPYTGKSQRASVKSVTLGGKTLKAGTDYTVSAVAGKKVGTYKLIVAGKGAYKDSVSTSFKIVPKKVTSFKVKAKGSKKVKTSWKKAKTQRSGVQVRYSLHKDMTKAKTTKAKGASVKSKTVKKLKKGKKYYVQVRAYKIVKGKTYYSSWSTKKTVKAK